MEAPNFFSKLSSQNISELERRTGISRQALHNALRTHNMKLDNLSAVANAMNLSVHFRPRASEENLLSSLVHWGVPLAHSGGGTFSLTETVEEGLKSSRKDGAYESLIPYLLVRNLNGLDPLALGAAAFRTKEVNTLAYFTEMANAFGPNEKFKFLLHLLAPAKNPSREFLVKSTRSHFPELFLKNPLAVKWNLKVRGTPDDHFRRWEKWDNSQKTS